MTQALAELDMDVFSKHLGPYFTWLESKIESGWQQNESVQKDVLKEVRSTATTMRARFILGVARQDFTKEVERALSVLELASEAFPQESDEVEAKIQQLTAGIAEKLGKELLPAKYRQVQVVETPNVVESKPRVEVVAEKPRMQLEPKVPAAVVKSKLVRKVEQKVQKAKQQKLSLKVKETKQLVKDKAKPVKTSKPKGKKAKRRSFLSRVFRNFVYGN